MDYDYNFCRVVYYYYDWCLEFFGDFYWYCLVGGIYGVINGDGNVNKINIDSYINCYLDGYYDDFVEFRVDYGVYVDVDVDVGV